MIGRRSARLVLALVFLAVPCLVFAGAEPAHKCIPRELTGEQALAHAGDLAAGSRVAGTPAEQAAAGYIASALEALGCQVEMQEFEILYFEDLGSEIEVISPEHRELQANTFMYSPPGDVTAPLIFCGLGGPNDFAGLEVAGKIALMRRGVYTFKDKVENAARAGAVGAIIFNHLPVGNILGTLRSPTPIHAAALSLADGTYLLSLLGEGPVVVRLTVNTIVEPRFSANVIGTKRATRGQGTGDAVVVGAHYDSVSAGPGANDNASGVATMLEVAAVLAPYRLATDVRYIAFGSEEIGLVGSMTYVRSLSEEELRRIVAMINLDMVAVGHEFSSGNIGGYGPDWLVRMAIAIGQAMGLEVSREPRSANSDHTYFEYAGIPVTFLTCRPDPYYHTAEDTVDKLQIANLDRVADVVGALVYELAKTPLPASHRGIVAKSHKYVSVYRGNVLDEE